MTSQFLDTWSCPSTFIYCSASPIGEQAHPALFGGVPEHFWQPRFYDFNVWSDAKRIEKLRYLHRNPVRRGLALEPDQWAWSSFRSYANREAGLVLVNAPGKLKIRAPAA